MIIRANKSIQTTEKQQEIKDRLFILIGLLLEEKKSVREMAEITGIAKSTVHRTLTVYTPLHYPNLWAAVEQEMENNYFKGVTKGGLISWEKRKQKKAPRGEKIGK